jgi:hypothetical protein
VTRFESDASSSRTASSALPFAIGLSLLPWGPIKATTNDKRKLQGTQSGNGDIKKHARLFSQRMKCREFVEWNYADLVLVVLLFDAHA